MTAATYEEKRKADLRRRQKAQDEVRETALAEVAAWPAEKARLVAEEKREEEAANHKLEMQRKQAAAAAKHRDAEQAMRESVALTERAAMTGTPADIAPMVNRQAIQHSAKQALSLFEQGFRTGEQAAVEAWGQEIQRLRSQMNRMAPSLQHGPPVQERSNATIGWASG